MCQLLGLSFNKEISPVAPFSKLVSNSLFHPDGWGVAYYIYQSKRPAIFKESIPAHESQLARFLIGYAGFIAKTFIGHIRKATTGSVTYDNTHPFNRYHAGCEYVFAHNGSLSKPKRLSRLYFQPIGNTDSERAFCYLLTQLRRSEITRIRRGVEKGYLHTDFVIIREILLEINARAVGSFCCIFSDGEYLFCYRDLKEARNLVSMRYQEYLPNKSVRPKQMNKNSTHGPGTATQGYVVATEPVTEGDWQSLTGGQLMVFKNGELVANIQ